MSSVSCRERKRGHTLVLNSHLPESSINISFSSSFTFRVLNWPVIVCIIFLQSLEVFLSRLFLTDTVDRKGVIFIFNFSFFCFHFRCRLKILSVP